MEDLLSRLRRFRDERDWAQFHTPKDLAISVSVEAGELLELFQWRKADAVDDASFRDQVGQEAADVYLYLLLLCERHGVDLQAAAHAKIDRNEARFPAATSKGVAKPVDESDAQ